MREPGAHWPRTLECLTMTRWIPPLGGRQDEPLPVIRGSQGHRKARHHQLCRRPALAQDLPKVARPSAACAQDLVVLGHDGASALQYAASEGYGPLREAIAEQLPWDVDPAQVLITTGSQRGLDLVAKVLIDAGSRVLVETPTYLGALQAFTPMEPQVAAVASDDEGVVVDDLPAKVGSGATGALPVRAAQLPEPHRPHHERGAPRRACGSGRRPGPAADRGQPLRRPVVRQPAAAPADGAQPRRLHLPGLVLQGAGARPAPGLPGRAQAVLYPSCCRRQAADLHPSFNQRLVAEVLRTAFWTATCPTIRALYRGSATPCWPRWRAEIQAWACLERPQGRHVPVGCACPKAWTPPRCCPRPWSATWPSCPAPPSPPTRRTRARCACPS